VNGQQRKPIGPFLKDMAPGHCASASPFAEWIRLFLKSLACFICVAPLQAQAPPDLPKEIRLLEAIRLTLQSDPQIQIQEKQIQVSQGISRQAAGAFDWTMETALSQGLVRTPRTEFERFQLGSFTNAANLVEDITHYRLGLRKQFRSGIAVSPGFEATRIADNLDRDRALNRANVNLVIHIPLLKNFGTDATGAFERAARISAEAATLEFQHTIANRLLNATTAFWNLLAARRQLEILHGSEARASNLVVRVQDLVNAGEFPGAELEHVRADFAEKSAATVAGAQRLVAARQTFGLALGLSPGQLNSTPLPADAFPETPGLIAPGLFQNPKFLEQSLQRRADYLASLKNESAAEVLLAAAQKNLKPTLDLELEVGYAGLMEGSQFQRYYSSLDPRNSGGLNAFGSLRFEWPFGNNAARGLWLQRQGVLDQTRLRTLELARTISSSLHVAISELIRAMEEFKNLQTAAGHFRAADENEKEKLRLGTTTVLDVITTADRLANAQLNAVAGQARVAGAVARLRYELGLLVAAGADRDITLREEDFITLPPENVLEAGTTRP
jgi:outer membrane protein